MMKLILQDMGLMRPKVDKTDDGFVFPGTEKGSGLSVMALATAMRRLKQGPFTVHGFRSTFRDWVSEETEFPREIAEAALACKLAPPCDPSPISFFNGLPCRSASEPHADRHAGSRRPQVLTATAMMDADILRRSPSARTIARLVTTSRNMLSSQHYLSGNHRGRRSTLNGSARDHWGWRGFNWRGPGPAGRTFERHAAP